MADVRNDEPPFEGGSQPVKQVPPEVPGPGRSTLQYVVIALGVLTLLAGLAYFVRLGMGT